MKRAPTHQLHQFRRSQTGGYPQPSSSLTTWRLTVRSLLAPKARIGAGLFPFPGTGADIAQADQFVEHARSLAGRSRAYAGVPTGAARLPAAYSNRAAGRPVPQRAPTRATNAGEEQSPAARIFLLSSCDTGIAGGATGLPSSTTRNAA